MGFAYVPDEERQEFRNAAATGTSEAREFLRYVVGKGNRTPRFRTAVFPDANASVSIARVENGNGDIETIVFGCKDGVFYEPSLWGSEYDGFETALDGKSPIETGVSGCDCDSSIEALGLDEFCDTVLGALLSAMVFR